MICKNSQMDTQICKCPECYSPPGEKALAPVSGSAKAPCSLVDELKREAKINSLCGSEEFSNLLYRAAESIFLANRLADYVRMFYEANPPMPEAVAVAWRDIEPAKPGSLEHVVSGDVETTLRVLWRTSGFLSGLSQDIKPLSPERAQSCRNFVDCLEEEARRLSANSKLTDHR